MSFNPKSVNKPKRLKRDSRRKVRFAPRLIQDIWTQPKRADECFLFYSEEDEAHARDEIDTCRDYQQYQREEKQSFRENALAHLKYRLDQQSKRPPIPTTDTRAAQRVSTRSTPQQAPQRVSNHPIAADETRARRTLTDVANSGNSQRRNNSPTILTNAPAPQRVSNPFRNRSISSVLAEITAEITDDKKREKYKKAAKEAAAAKKMAILSNIWMQSRQPCKKTAEEAQEKSIKEELKPAPINEKQTKQTKVRHEPTQTNYYDELAEITDDDEEMEQEPTDRSWGENNGVMGICEKLSRTKRNNERKQRNKQKAKSRVERCRKQLAAKKGLAQSKLTMRQEFNKRANEKELNQTKQAAKAKRQSPRLDPATKQVAQSAYKKYRSSDHQECSPHWH